MFLWPLPGVIRWLLHYLTCLPHCTATTLLTVSNASWKGLGPHHYANIMS